MIRWLIGFLVLGGASVRAQSLPVGQIVENVVCQADATQHYALYLPSMYAPEKAWPILYGFDPGGRGRQPVERFREAAEKYGWIVIGSHNSRNGPGVPLNDIINALWRDTHERLSIDDRRVYTTGMSGGARVASSLAVGLKDRVAGVIACGAGFSYAQAPRKDMRFAYFSIAGVEDFNLIELDQLEEALEKAGMAHQLLTFEGGHTWPAPALLAEGVEWMEAQAMRTERRPKEPARIAALYADGLQRARQFEADSHPYDAYVRYRMLAAAFQGLCPTTEAAAAAQRLQASKEVQSMTAQLKLADRQQEQQWRDLSAILTRLQSEETQLQAVAEARSLIGRLRKKAEDAAPSGDRMLARRMMGQISVSVSEGATGELYRKNYAQAAAMLTIAAELRPENPQTWYRLAAAQAQAFWRRQAIESLKRAVEHGFKDAARLETAPEFAALRQEKEFQALLQRLKASAPAARTS